MKIVGFQSGHDVSYCILENGIPIIHEEYERFLREKEPLGDGLKWFFDNNYKLDDLKYFVEGNPFNRNSGKYGKIHPYSLDEPYNKMKKHIGEKQGYHYIVSHHQSHAANAFFSSNHEEALIITIDGGGVEKRNWQDVQTELGGSIRGKGTSFTVWSGVKNKIAPIKIYKNEEVNLGAFYQAVTKEIFNLSVGHPYGFQGGTVMAMACMGDSEVYFDFFYNMLRGKNELGAFSSKIHLKKLSNRGMVHHTYKDEDKDLFDIAAGAQKALEERARKIITPYIEEYNPKNICLSGGVVLNSVMVGKMYDWFPNVEDIYVCPVPYDAGLCIGSAQYIYHQVMDYPRIKWKDNASPYLGRVYGKDEILDTLNNSQELYEKLQSENITISWDETNDDEVVQLLTENDNVISVFGGGSESGRRALGNRSILADPRSPKMKDIINEKVKHRQWFRPFAPSITREDVKDWFEKDVNSPYMTSVIKFKEEVRDKVPAVVHFDGTARLQTVTKNDNEWYHGFIKKFQKKTGVPILLNTSFNDREPIVETPEHAINCFLRTNIDYLYFREHGILVRKNG